ncbi:MAG: hypothetical protein NHB14_00615 [Desulfosporosinus sp.]|nr:hypothetical protein [Desulfosporosinus sp.]MDA8221983.1 hypothetical protein [Desulfitobacterium hafniense]
MQTMVAFLHKEDFNPKEQKSHSNSSAILIAPAFYSKTPGAILFYLNLNELHILLSAKYFS